MGIEPSKLNIGDEVTFHARIVSVEPFDFSLFYSSYRAAPDVVAVQLAAIRKGGSGVARGR
jgi:hypothetical protein